MPQCSTRAAWQAQIKSLHKECPKALFLRETVAKSHASNILILALLVSRHRDMGTDSKPLYSAKAEARRIFNLLCTSFDPIALPPDVCKLESQVEFTADRDFPYFFIPFKETETGAALKAIEACLACLLCDLKLGGNVRRGVRIDLEKTTAFLCQAYMAKVGGLGKLDPQVKDFLKGTIKLLLGT